MTVLIILLVLLALAAVAYWLWQAHITAKHMRRVFAPRVHVPDARTSTELAQRRNGFDPCDDRELPMLLKRQAE